MIIIVYDFDIVIIGVLCVQILILRLKKRKSLAPSPKTGAANILSQWSRREEDAAARENEGRDCGRVKVREWVWTEKVGVKISSWVNTKNSRIKKSSRCYPLFTQISPAIAVFDIGEANAVVPKHSPTHDRDEVSSETRNGAEEEGVVADHDKLVEDSSLIPLVECWENVWKKYETKGKTN